MEIVKKTLSNQIYEVLKLEILRQEIQFGEKLVNRSLQERFGVSSSPIRDAINRLYSDGLVDDITNSGAKVISFDLDFALEINDLLILIIAGAMRLSYKRSNLPDICKELQDNIDKQTTYLGTDSYFEYDYKFHKTFIDHCNNQRLKNLYKKFHVLHEILVRNFHGSKNIEVQKQSIRMHEDIVKALENNDINLAVAITQDHYDVAEKLFRKMFSSSIIENK